MAGARVATDRPTEGRGAGRHGAHANPQASPKRPPRERPPWPACHRGTGGQKTVGWPERQRIRRHGRRPPPL